MSIEQPRNDNQNIFMRCVECNAPINALVAKYGKDLNCLLPCAECKEKRADRYVEYDSILIFIDLVLHRQSVYRHLLFNRPSLEGAQSSLTAHRIGMILLLLEVYIKWEGVNLTGWSFTSQYMILLISAVIECAVAMSVVMGIGQANGCKVPMSDAILAQVISNYPKALHFLMVIWGFKEDLEYHILIRLLSFSSSIEVMSALFSVSYMKAFCFAALPLAASELMKKLLFVAI
jgi:hypothetical protein